MEIKLDKISAAKVVETCDALLASAPPVAGSANGSARAEDMAMLIRRLCRVVARHDANNAVREQALDYLHRKGLGGSPLKGKAPNC